MLGDNYQVIRPTDRLIIDKYGNVAGVQNPHAGSNGEGRMLNPTEYLMFSSAGISLYVPPVVNISRNSDNTTDTNSVTMATFVIPPNVLRVGSIIEVWALWQNTNSSSTKNFSVNLNGNARGGASATTAQATGVRYPFHVQDANTLLVLNNGTSGTGSSAGVPLSTTITGVVAAGLTVTLTSSWGANVSGENITLVHAKLNLIL